MQRYAPDAHWLASRPSGLTLGTGVLCLFFNLLCYAAVLKFLTYYAQYYAHVKTVLLEYIHLYQYYHGDCSIRVYLKFYTTVVQIIILSALLEYIDH